MKVLVCCMVLLLVGIVAYEIIAPSTPDNKIKKATANLKEDAAQPAPSVDKAEEIETVSEQQVPKTDNIEKRPDLTEAIPSDDAKMPPLAEPQTPDIGKIEESEADPDTEGDMITYEPPEIPEGFLIDLDGPDISRNNMIDLPSAGKTKHPISGVFFVKDGKVTYPASNPDDFPFGLRVYSDIMIMTNPAIQYVTVYYFRTKKERSAFQPERHRW